MSALPNSCTKLRSEHGPVPMRRSENQTSAIWLHVHSLDSADVKDTHGRCLNAAMILAKVHFHIVGATGKCIRATPMKVRLDHTTNNGI
jgi:hypothetical protein